jgi:hypothetical protein
LAGALDELVRVVSSDVHEHGDDRRLSGCVLVDEVEL